MLLDEAPQVGHSRVSELLPKSLDSFIPLTESAVSELIG